LSLVVGIVYYITIMRNSIRASMLGVSAQFSNIWTRNKFLSNWIDAAYNQNYINYEGVEREIQSSYEP